MHYVIVLYALNIMIVAKDAWKGLHVGNDLIRQKRRTCSGAASFLSWRKLVGRLQRFMDSGF